MSGSLISYRHWSSFLYSVLSDDCLLAPQACMHCCLTPLASKLHPLLKSLVCLP